MLTLSKLILSSLDALRVAWAWTKKNWKFVTGFAIASLIFILTRKKFDWEKYHKKAKEDYEKEIKSIKKSHSDEIEKRDRAIEEYIKKTDKIDKDYKKKLLDLDEKSRERAVELLDESGNDQDALTKKLSELTGFKVHD